MVNTGISIANIRHTGRNARRAEGDAASNPAICGSASTPCNWLAKFAATQGTSGSNQPNLRGSFAVGHRGSFAVGLRGSFAVGHRGSTTIAALRFRCSAARDRRTDATSAGKTPARYSASSFTTRRSTRRTRLHTAQTIATVHPTLLNRAAVAA